MPRIANPVSPVRLRTAPPRIQCGCSSVGRARPCQGRGHEFEPRYPLQKTGSRRVWPPSQTKCGCSSVGRARPCQGRGHEFEPRYPLQFVKKGSPSGFPFSLVHAVIMRPRPGGEIGRRSGLKIRRPCGHTGSIPVLGTTTSAMTRAARCHCSRKIC
eukprot:Opistho-1_new@37829